MDEVTPPFPDYQTDRFQDFKVLRYGGRTDSQHRRKVVDADRLTVTIMAEVPHQLQAGGVAQRSEDSGLLLDSLLFGFFCLFLHIFILVFK